MQTITVKINQYSDNLFLSCLYIPPSCVNDETFLRLENYLNNLILGPSEKHILCGDFNVNFLIKSKNSTKLRNLLLGSNLNLYGRPEGTRETKTSKSMIDCFFSNFHTITKVQKTSITDHYTVTCDLNYNENIIEKEIAPKRRCWEKLKDPKFIAVFSQELLQKLIPFKEKITTNSPNDNFKILHKMLIDLLDEKLPYKTKITNAKTWIDNQVKNAANKKNKFRQLTLKFPQSIEAAEKYRSQCKTVKNLVRCKLRQFYQQKLETQSKQNTKSFFNVYNELTGNKKVGNTCTPNLNADEFNGYFADIGNQLNKQFAASDNIDIPQHSKSMFLWDIEISEVEDSIMSCKDKYSLDCFDLNLVFLKSLNNVVISHFNRSF